LNPINITLPPRVLAPPPPTQIRAPVVIPSPPSLAMDNSVYHGPPGVIINPDGNPALKHLQQQRTPPPNSPQTPPGGQVSPAPPVISRTPEPVLPVVTVGVPLGAGLNKFPVAAPPFVIPTRTPVPATSPVVIPASVVSSSPEMGIRSPVIFNGSSHGGIRAPIVNVTMPALIKHEKDANDEYNSIVDAIPTKRRNMGGAKDSTNAEKSAALAIITFLKKHKMKVTFQGLKRYTIGAHI